MAKRKAKRDPHAADAQSAGHDELPDAPPPSKRKGANDDSDDSGSDEDMDMVNVDFEWFDPQPAVDFHGLKTLLRQLLDVDAPLFALSSLADLILSQPLLGSTVKVDGVETDPYAFLTVLNLATHRGNDAIQQLTQYMGRHAQQAGGALAAHLPPLLAPESRAQVGLILTERFINMPHEIVPPMYTILQDEIKWAVEEKEPYQFTHYLVLSKTYNEIGSTLPSMDTQPPGKKRRGGNGGSEETFYYHPEDEVLHRYATAFGSFDYQTPVDAGASDAKRAFQDVGVKSKCHLILIEADKFAGAVDALRTYLTGQ